jgi:hypothetical protein
MSNYYLFRNIEKVSKVRKIFYLDFEKELVSSRWRRNEISTQKKELKDFRKHNI